MSEKLHLQEISRPLADHLARLQEAVADAPVQSLPAFIGELERLKAQAWSKLSPPSGSSQPIAVHDRSINPSVDQSSEPEYLSIRDLARRINYAEGTIRNLMSRGVFKFGEHYVKPRGRILFKWAAIRNWVEKQGAEG